jgi:hypothetical protein
MKTIQVLLDTVPFDSKPSQEETGRIVERLKKTRPIQLTVQEILQAQLQGRTIIPSGIATQKGFISQQIWMVDVDGTVPLRENLEHKPAFAYSTFSDTDGSRYRLAFVSDTPVTDLKQATAIQMHFNALCGGDKVCKNINRLYFGGKAELYRDFDSTFNPALITVFSSMTPKPKARRTPHPQTFDEDRYKQALQAIDLMDIEALKGLIGPVEPLVVDTMTELYHEVQKADLSRILCVPIGKLVISPLRDDDTNPSANIYVTESGIQVVHDHGTGDNATLVKLVERRTGVHTRAAVEFIAKVLDITVNVENAYQCEMRDKYKFNQMILEDESFSINYPYTAKRIRYDNYVAVKFAELAGELARSEERSYKGMPIIIVSQSKLAEYIGRSRQTANGKIQHLNYLGFITKLALEDCDPYTAMQLETMRRGRDKLTNAYAVTILTEANLSVIESRARTLAENHYTKRGASREYMQRTFQKAANTFYPQYIAINNQYSKKATQLHNLINTTAQDLYKSQGYWTEKQVIDRLSDEHSPNVIKTQLKRTLPQILRENQWQRTRDKATRDRLGLKPTRGAPPFIVTRHGDN